MRALLALVGLVAVASGCSSGSTVADAPAQAGGRAAAGAAGAVKVAAGAAGSSTAGVPWEAAGVPPVEAAGDPNAAGAAEAAGSDAGGAAGFVGVGGEAGVSAGGAGGVAGSDAGSAGVPSGGAGAAGVGGAGSPQGGAGVAGASSAGAGAGDGGTAGAGVAGGAGSAGAGGGLSAACTPTIASYKDAETSTAAKTIVYERYLTFSCSGSAHQCSISDPLDSSGPYQGPWVLLDYCGAYRAGPYCDSVLWTGDTFGKMQMQSYQWYICVQASCPPGAPPSFWQHIQGC